MKPTCKLIFVIAFFALALIVASPALTQNTRQVGRTQAITMQDYARREQMAPPDARQKLTELRQRIKERNLGFEVGYTYAMERSGRSITGGDFPPNILETARKQNVIARKAIKIDRAARDLAIQMDPGIRAKLPELTISCNANAKTFDWRWSGKVTPVKVQGCGNCWAYGAMAPLESSYLIRNNMTIDGSEQFIVSNSGAGTCQGGGAKGAIDFLVSTGTTTEANLPDSGTNGTPDVNDFPKPYQALVSGFVSDTEQIPAVSEIKAAMCEHGPVVSWIGVTDSFVAYTGPSVYKDDDYANELKKPCPASGPINGAVCGHFVTIIGWSDPKHAWLIKNSWGPNWGNACGAGTERGYMWIDYNSNQIGAGAIWEEARNNLYRLPPIYYELLPQLKLIDPGPLRIPDVLRTPTQIRPLQIQQLQIRP
jgi:hypothetical protein